ncbi:MAG: hypothetical protein AAGJ28_00280 [Pseudomonadota bacterium]
MFDAAGVVTGNDTVLSQAGGQFRCPARRAQKTFGMLNRIPANVAQEVSGVIQQNAL